MTGLLSLPEEKRPIIILQADEGPGTTAYQNQRLKTWDWNKATPDDVEAKYGILNAWYVPGGAEVGLYPSQTSINTFPLLFRDYFGLDYEPQPTGSTPAASTSCRSISSTSRTACQVPSRVCPQPGPSTLPPARGVSFGDVRTRMRCSA